MQIDITTPVAKKIISDYAKPSPEGLAPSLSKYGPFIKAYFTKNKTVYEFSAKIYEGGNKEVPKLNDAILQGRTLGVPDPNLLVKIDGNASPPDPADSLTPPFPTRAVFSAVLHVGGQDYTGSVDSVENLHNNFYSLF